MSRLRLSPPALLASGDRETDRPKMPRVLTGLSFPADSHWYSGPVRNRVPRGAAAGNWLGAKARQEGGWKLPSCAPGRTGQEGAYGGPKFGSTEGQTPHCLPGPSCLFLGPAHCPPGPYINRTYGLDTPGPTYIFVGTEGF